MNVTRAILWALVLLAVSIVGATMGDQATDPIVVAGGVGIIISAALLSLTVLAVRWRHGSRGYDATLMSGERFAQVDDVAASFGVPATAVDLAEDSAAV
jgi:hypothetical protein